MEYSGLIQVRARVSATAHYWEQKGEGWGPDGERRESEQLRGRITVRQARGGRSEQATGRGMSESYPLAETKWAGVGAWRGQGQVLPYRADDATRGGGAAH